VVLSGKVQLYQVSLAEYGKRDLSVHTAERALYNAKELGNAVHRLQVKLDRGLASRLEVLHGEEAATRANFAAALAGRYLVRSVGGLQRQASTLVRARELKLASLDLLFAILDERLVAGVVGEQQLVLAAVEVRQAELELHAGLPDVVHGLVEFELEVVEETERVAEADLERKVSLAVLVDEMRGVEEEWRGARKGVDQAHGIGLQTRRELHAD